MENNNRQGCRWVKASERNPDKEGLYFVKMADGEKDVNRYAEFYTGDGIEWLDETVLYWLDESIPCATSSENYWKQRCEAAEAVITEADIAFLYKEGTDVFNYWQQIKSQTPSHTGDRDCEELKEPIQKEDNLREVLLKWVEADDDFERGYRNKDGKETRVGIAGLSQTVSEASRNLKRIAKSLFKINYDKS